MRKFSYKKINAFTSEMSCGNPAAYLLLNEEGLSSADMLKVAKEHSGFVSEVVFCTASRVADMKLTFYSSECEVDFCGHGTIATMYDLIKCNENLLAKEEILIETNKKGILAVFNCINREDTIYITAPKAKQLRVSVNIQQIATALSISQDYISTEYPVDLIDAGLRTLIVPISEFHNEISIFPTESELKTFCLENQIDILLIFCKATSRPSYFAHTRVFAPKFGYLEDPATGSGNSAFGNYLDKYGLWDGSPISIEQGGENIAFNTIRLKLVDNKVLFGGKATVSIEGEYYL